MKLKIFSPQVENSYHPPFVVGSIVVPHSPFVLQKVSRLEMFYIQSQA
jgi:hypothetical protein